MAASAEMVRKLLICATSGAMAAFNSQSEKNCWLRSFGTINRIATCAATSTLAFVPRPMRPLADAARGALSPTRAVADVPCWRLLATDKADPPWAQDVDFPK